jgi:hypothetical protein
MVYVKMALTFAEGGIQPESISEAFHAFQHGKTPAALSPLSAAGLSNQTIQESMRLLLLIRAHQVRVFPLAKHSCRYATRRKLFHVPCGRETVT